MTMPEVAVSQFIFAERFITVTAPDDSSFAGFEAEVRQNLSNGERKQLIEQIEAAQDRYQQQIDSQQEEAKRLDAAMRDATDADARREAQRAQRAMVDLFAEWLADFGTTLAGLVAPFVRDWNVYERNESGEPVKVEAPATAGPAAFAAISDDMVAWLRDELIKAYRSGKGVTNRSKPPGDSGLPTGGPKRASAKGTKTSGTRLAPTSSSGLSASTFQA